MVLSAQSVADGFPCGGGLVGQGAIKGEMVGGEKDKIIHSVELGAVHGNQAVAGALLLFQVVCPLLELVATLTEPPPVLDAMWHPAGRSGGPLSAGADQGILTAGNDRILHAFSPLAGVEGCEKIGIGLQLAARPGA